MLVYGHLIKKPRGAFGSAHYRVVLVYKDGSPFYRTVRNPVGTGNICISDPVDFYGSDGRKVRAEALAFAKLYAHTVTG